MTPRERRELQCQCRYACIDDTRGDGVCRFVLKFKVADRRMDAVMLRMSHEDACDIASSICDMVCTGCEDCYDDWMDPDEENFTLEFCLEEGYIVMKGAYRT